MKKISLLLSVLISVNVISAQIIHVPGHYNSIQDAINASTNGDTILVGEGTYFENINYIGKSITVASWFMLDGEKSHIENTIINGSKPSNKDTASVIVMISGEDSLSVLDGFTITGGFGSLLYHYEIPSLILEGGGVLIINSGGKIINNIITGNNLLSKEVSVTGGGIDIWLGEKSNAVVRNNQVKGNFILSDFYARGGGINVHNDKGRLVIENNEISDNTATRKKYCASVGGGISLSTTQPWNAEIILRNNRISRNKVTGDYAVGAGIYFLIPAYTGKHADRVSSIEIYNNIISNNNSEHFGGGIALWDNTQTMCYCKNPVPVIYNNTITGNIANHGTGLFTHNMKPLLFNNIIWNRARVADSEELYNGNYAGINLGSFLALNNSISKGYEGIGNTDGYPKLDEKNLSLQVKSPCIGLGWDSLYISNTWYRAPLLDINGINRRLSSQDQKIDMGAQESCLERTYRISYISDRLIKVPEDKPAIQVAIDAASENDTILVSPGIYYENVNFRGKAVTLMSYFGMDNNKEHIASTIINGSFRRNPDTASVILMVSGEDTTSVLKGFTLTGGTGTILNHKLHTCREGGGILIVQSGGLIEDNIITCNHLTERGTTQASGAGISILNHKGPVSIIRHNTIMHNLVDSESGSRGGGISLSGGDFLIEHNLIYNNTCKTVAENVSGGGIDWRNEEIKGVPAQVTISENEIFLNRLLSETPGILSSGAGMNFDCNLPVRNINIQNNLIYLNRSDGMGGGISMAGKSNIVCCNNTIFNNLAKINGNSISLNNAGQAVIFNNIIWSNKNKNKNELADIGMKESTAIYAQYNNIRGGYNGDGNIDEDPKFKSGSFELDFDSPCIGAGITWLEVSGKKYVAPCKDLMNNIRPGARNKSVDIGAIESDFATDISVFEFRNELLIFPNPASQNSTVRFYLDKKIAARLIIFDTLGNEKMTYTCGSDIPGEYEIQLDITELNSGIYILCLFTDRTYCSKLVVK
ncbi:MAG: right-handed parallel beta-helix repeat-containing protein [Bacteroidales bacterium]|nr:right-handed parallel beta-helix repeat-containing protein [Bacteroidales bacterium]